MEGLQIVKDGKWFVVRMAPEIFANFALDLLKKSEEGEDNGEPAKRRGRPPRESQQTLVEQEG